MQKKNVGVRIRVEEKLREEFHSACEAQGKPAAQVLREFMREYSVAYRSHQQGDLFSGLLNGQSEH